MPPRGLAASVLPKLCSAFKVCAGRATAVVAYGKKRAQALMPPLSMSIVISSPTSGCECECRMNLSALGCGFSTKHARNKAIRRIVRRLGNVIRMSKDAPRSRSELPWALLAIAPGASGPVRALCLRAFRYALRAFRERRRPLETCYLCDFG
jgi:hypothetical protein